jgi:hypothetical protein
MAHSAIRNRVATISECTWRWSSVICLPTSADSTATERPTAAVADRSTARSPTAATLQPGGFPTTRTQLTRHATDRTRSTPTRRPRLAVRALPCPPHTPTHATPCWGVERRLSQSPPVPPPPLVMPSIRPVGTATQCVCRHGMACRESVGWAAHSASSIARANSAPSPCTRRSTAPYQAAVLSQLSALSVFVS